MTDIRNPYSMPNPDMHPAGTVLLIRDHTGDEHVTTIVDWLASNRVRLSIEMPGRNEVKTRKAEHVEIVRVLEGI